VSPRTHTHTHTHAHTHTRTHTHTHVPVDADSRPLYAPRDLAAAASRAWTCEWRDRRWWCELSPTGLPSCALQRRTHARMRALQRRTYARTPERTTERTLTRAHTPIHTLALRDELWMLSRVTFSRRSDRFALSSLTLLSRSTPPSVDDESVTHTAGKIPTLPFWPTLPEKRDREVKRNDGCEQQATKHWRVIIFF
jgi:hypothetical protein